MANKRINGLTNSPNPNSSYCMPFDGPTPESPTVHSTIEQFIDNKVRPYTLAEYSLNTTYALNDYCISGEKVFKSLAANNIANLVTDGTKWRQTFDMNGGTPSRTIYIDCNRTDTYIEDGTLNRPFKTVSGSAAAMTGPITIQMATGIYTETGNIEFPNFPMVVYGNGSTLDSDGHSIIINNPYFVRKDLFTIGNVTYNGFNPDARALISGGGISGNVTINSFVEFFQCQLNDGVITVGNTGFCVVNLCTPSSRFLSTGTLVMNQNIITNNYAGYLVDSTDGQLLLTNNVISNLNTGIGGAVRCNNGASTNPNYVANNDLSSLGSGSALECGTTATVVAKNHIPNGTHTGSHFIAASDDAVGANTHMLLGDDATGDVYYRNTQGMLTRLAIGANTTALRGGVVPTFATIPTILGYTPENVANKVTSISGSSTDTQYPSAKLAYDQLALKVDKVSGKALSTNDLTNTLKTNYDTAYTNNHTHSNKSDLDLLSGTNTGDNAINSLYSGLAASKQNALNGTGFVKISGTTISYDNSTYLTSIVGVTVSQVTSQTIGTTGNRLTKLWTTDLTCTNPIDGRLLPPAGSIVAGTAPIKLTSGPLLTTAEVGAIEFLDDKFYATITTGAARKEIQFRDTYYGEMYSYENTTITNIRTANVYHAIGAVNIVTGVSDRVTFTAGVSGNIAAVSNYNGTVPGTVLVTVSAGHNLTTGDVITITSASNYIGIYTVTRISVTEFYITHAYVNSQAGTYTRGARLKVNTGGAGIYRASMSLTAFAASASKDFKFEICVNTTEPDKIVTSRRFTNTDYTPMSASGLLQLADNDVVWVAMMNQTDTTDITVVHSNINMVRL